MNFFLDANLPCSLKDIFSRYGEVWHTNDVGLQSAIDQDVFNFAVSKRAILVTRDLDFGNPYLYPKEAHHGIIILRVPSHYNSAQIKNIFADFLSAIELEDLLHFITVIEPGKIRIR